jgi:hypothetical protein
MEVRIAMRDACTQRQHRRDGVNHMLLCIASAIRHRSHGHGPVH